MNAFNKLCTEFYDIDKPTAPPDALEFYLRFARECSQPILEPMCGSGRFLIPMLASGIDIDGLDASLHMLAACREKCHRRGLSPWLSQQSLHEMDVPRKYGLVFIAAGSFNLVTDADQVKQSLRRIHEAMLPGARLLLETGRRKPTESSSWPWGGRWVRRPDGAKIVISWLGHYDATTSISRNVHRYELIKDGRLVATEFEDFDLRCYALAELQDLLERAGFRCERILKTYDVRPPDETDEDCIIECIRGTLEPEEL
ncbi:MAG TPA: class I SAM-dependent methyltransferase, partial [Tepidisphaeraceae bacterium]